MKVKAIYVKIQSVLVPIPTTVTIVTVTDVPLDFINFEITACKEFTKFTYFHFNAVLVVKLPSNKDVQCISIL